MSYPPPALDTSRTNSTAQQDTHPTDHNDVNGAVNDIVAELGTDPSGAAADVETRIDNVDTRIDNVEATAEGHAARHASGGADAITAATPVTIKKAGTSVGTRRGVNLIEGTDITLTVSDDSGNDEVDVTVAAAGGGPTLIRKTADESVTSSTTLQNDDELLYSIAANEVALWELVVYYTSVTADLQVSFAVPAGATIKWGATAREVNWVAHDADADTAVLGSPGTATLQLAIIRGYIANGGTAGDVQFEWSQNSSSGNATTVNLGSHMIVHTVA